MTSQKWEAKLLETRVAEFNRAPNAAEEDDSPPESSHQSTNASPPQTAGAGPSSRPQQNTPQPGGLALPGRPANGVGMVQGWPGPDGTRVKQDPDDVMRPRGGAVSIYRHCKVEEVCY